LENLFYTYDELDNRKAIRFPDGNWLTSTFDAANRLATNQLPSGVTVSYQYDFAGRIMNRSSTIGETHTFQYNLADAVTLMTDNTGSTTNLYDAGGRFIGINYPTGSTVRYGLDLLGRITIITNRVSSTGTGRITRYRYDAVGNITNVIDPFGGVTLLEYDRVGRKTRRTLPNGVVTTYEYNWRDQLVNIVHMTSNGTTLASAFYERAPFGEPTKVTREDGAFVVLKYDASLRLTNEIYHSAGGTPQTTNSYGYDVSGNRIRLVTGGVTYTNLVSAGYRITQVKNGASVAETYAYDNGGRVTSMTRDSATRTFGYNSSDQLTAVTNGATWTTYSHDAQGRRTRSTDDTGAERKFLLAGTPGTDLESPQFITDSTNGLRQGYVYVGDDPLIRYDGAGATSRVYYLEDAMGSVIGLTPHSSPDTTNTSRLFYDGFGKTRMTNGPAPALPSGAGGDFRFHGAWWESATDLYHMRAREYDQRLGRFMSRDPDEGSFRVPETINPYIFANDNPQVFSDPSGKFTLIEINISSLYQAALQSTRAVGVSKAKSKLFRMVGNAIKDQLVAQLKNFFPVPDMLSSFNKAEQFSDVLMDYFCREFPTTDKLYLEVPVTEDGTPRGNGFNCNKGVDQDKLMELVRTGVPRPDFIIGPKAPRSRSGGYNKTWLVGELKSTLATLYNDYKAPEPRQFNAIVNYAAKHTYSRVALFICAVPGRLPNGKPPPSEDIIKTMILQKGVDKGAIPLVLVIIDK
jgi:RHS repeat-associated protein